MSIDIYYNAMAANAALNLNNTYSQLSTATQQLSSGLRINSSADDAAGLAVREIMRSDISTINQGLRNAQDAISMIQTADGAMSVIDEKLIRMKELAEQAATGTYTTAQRSLMNSEYQAMGAEVTRIANATNFNGVKLLDGSLQSENNGSGMKIHFGTGNNAADDYYYVQIGDMRATSATGLRVGDSDTNQILRSTTSGISAATATTAFGSGGLFGIETSSDGGTTWNTYGYVNVTSGTDNLSSVMTQINQGSAQTGSLSLGSSLSSHSNAGATITIGTAVFTFSSTTNFASTTFNAATMTGTIGTSGAISGSSFSAVLSGLINRNVSSIGVWAGVGGTVGTTISLTDATLGSTATVVTAVAGATSISANQTNLSGGGGTDVTASIYQNTASNNYQLELTDNNIGADYQVRLVSTHGTNVTAGTFVSQFLNTDATGARTTTRGDFTPATSAAADWSTVQSAAGNTTWAGAQINTQSAAQQALAAIDAAITMKDTARAHIGAIREPPDQHHHQPADPGGERAGLRVAHQRRGRGHRDDPVHPGKHPGPGRRGHAGPGQQPAPAGPAAPEGLTMRHRPISGLILTKQPGPHPPARMGPSAILGPARAAASWGQQFWGGH